MPQAEVKMKSPNRWFREKYVLPVKRAEAVGLLTNLLPDLLQLRKSLIDIAAHNKKALRHADEHLTLMVLFFITVKPWHDGDRLNALIQAFKDAEMGNFVAELFYHASFSGDRKYIQSEPGVQVACSKIFLGGDRPNVPLLSIADWKEEKGNALPVSMGSNGEPLTAYQVILDDAQRFIHDHAWPLASSINRLEDFARAYDRQEAA